MINFDSLTLSALKDELCSILVGGRVHKVQQPTKYEFILAIRAQGTNRRLCISVHPKYSYIALLDHSNRELLNPDKPPMFCMLLRKHMKGAKILDIRQPENERILDICFESFNELEDRVHMTLSCEIMGKYSNVILYTPFNKIILGCAHTVGEHQSSYREVAGSLKYIPPPPQHKISILQISFDEFINSALALNEPIDIWLNTSFQYISLALAREICNVCNINIFPDKYNINTVDNLAALYELTYSFLLERDFKPSISEDKELFSLLAKDPSVNWEAMGSVNRMVDLYFAYHIEKDRIRELKTALKSRINKEIKRLKGKIAKLDETLTRAENAEKYRIKADILTSNLYKIKANEKEVTLENFYDDNKPIIIELDHMLTANQNAQRYYKLYNKAKNSIEITQKRRDKEFSDLHYYEGLIFNIEISFDLITLEEIREELDNQLKPSAPKDKAGAKQAVLNFLTFNSIDNFEILVGKNNKQNDYLISKLAHPMDLWLHTQIAHGSHVIIRTERGTKEVPETTLHEAALLAGYYSEGRYSSTVPIVYTLKKFVKKPSGAHPGFVIYSNEKTLYVNPLEEHVRPILDRLKQV